MKTKIFAALMLVFVAACFVSTCAFAGKVEEPIDFTYTPPTEPTPVEVTVYYYDTVKNTSLLSGSTGTVTFSGTTLAVTTTPTTTTTLPFLSTTSGATLPTGTLTMPTTTPIITGAIPVPTVTTPAPKVNATVTVTGTSKKVSAAIVSVPRSVVLPTAARLEAIQKLDVMQGFRASNIPTRNCGIVSKNGFAFKDRRVLAF